MGGIEELSITGGSVCIINTQLPEYPQPTNMPKGVEIVFTHLVLLYVKALIPSKILSFTIVS